MIDLRMIAIDGDVLLLGGATSAEVRYRLPLTPELRAAIAAPPGARQTAALVRQPTMRPAQVQARLRAGASIAEVAREAGADHAWVERWSGPVEAERRQVIRGALSSVVRPPARGDSATVQTAGATLDELVRAWLPSNVDPSRVEWTTARRRDGRWRLTMQIAAAQRSVTATWLWDVRTQHAVPASARARVISGLGE